MEVRALWQESFREKVQLSNQLGVSVGKRYFFVCHFSCRLEVPHQSVISVENNWQRWQRHNSSDSCNNAATPSANWSKEGLSAKNKVINSSTKGNNRKEHSV